MATTDYHQKIRVSRSRRRASQEAAGIQLSQKQFEDYLDKLAASGCASNTIQIYRRNLDSFFHFLDEDKYVEAGTVVAWQEYLLESGYSARTVNSYLSAANGLMRYLGHVEFQGERLEEEESIQQELTRAEYLRLLSAARTLGKERAYLLVKLFGTTGLSVGDVVKVTAEAVWAGKIILSDGTLRISSGLRDELLHFMHEEGITSGPVFLSKKGTPQDRATISIMVKGLGKTARVPEEKCNPRCLRRLYQATQAGIWENISILAEQAYDRLLEKEQRAIGWGLKC